MVGVAAGAIMAVLVSMPMTMVTAAALMVFHETAAMAMPVITVAVAVAMAVPMIMVMAFGGNAFSTLCARTKPGTCVLHKTQSIWGN